MRSWRIRRIGRWYVAYGNENMACHRSVRSSALVRVMV